MTAWRLRSPEFDATGSIRGLVGLAVFFVWATALPQDQTVEPPDFNGVWLATSPRSAGGENRPALTARAQADLDAFDPLDDPVIRCVPPGFPRSGLIIYPFEIVQADDMVVFLYESFGMIRRIYMDGRELPDYLPPAISGYSAGRWDGDELVVETTGVAPGLLSGGGIRSTVTFPSLSATVWWTKVGDWRRMSRSRRRKRLLGRGRAALPGNWMLTG